MSVPHKSKQELIEELSETFARINQLEQNEAQHTTGESQRQAKQVTLLYEVGQRVSGKLELDTLLPEIVTSIRDAFECYAVLLLLLDEKSNRLIQCAAATRETGVFPSEVEMPLGQGMTGQAAATGETLLSNDVSQEPNFIRVAAEETESELAVPIKSAGRVIGVLDLQSDQPATFGVSDAAAVETLSTQIATAIENARLYEESRRRAEEQAVLTELGQTLTTRLSVAEILEEAHKGASRLMDTSGFYIGLYDPTTRQVTFPFNVTESEIDRQITSLAADEGLTGHIITNQTSLLFEDNVVEHHRALGIEHVGAEAQSWLGVPLMVGDQVLGVMAVQSYTTPKLYGEHERELLTAIANQTAIALQNSRLFEETNNRAMRLAAVNRVAKALGSTLNPEELMDLVYQEMVLTFHAEAFFIALHDEEANELDFCFVMDAGERIPSGRSPVGDGVTASIVKSRKPLIIRNFEEERERLPQIQLMGTMEAPASWMGAPLMVGDRVVGVISIQAYRPYAWDDEDEQLLLTIADQVAVALENARLFEERERRVTELAIVNEIGQAISHTMDVDELLETIYRQVGRVFDTTNFYIANYQEGAEWWRTILHTEQGEKRVPQQYPLSQGLTSYIIRRRQPLLFQSTQEIDAFHEQQGVPRIEDTATSWMGVPLIVAEKVVGVMGIQNYEHESLYGERELALFSTIAAQVAPALNNLRLLEEARRRADEMEAVNGIARAVTSVLDLDDILHTLVDTIKARFGYYCVGVILIEQGQPIFRCGSDIGTSDTRLQMPPTVVGTSEGPSLIRQAIRTGQPVLVNDVTADPRFLPVEDLPDTQSELSVPIQVQNRIIGVLDVQSDQLSAFDTNDVELLQTLASQVGSVLENGRLFTEVQIRAEELAALNELGRALTAHLSVEEVMIEAHRQASRLIDTTHFRIGLLDSESNKIAIHRLEPDKCTEVKQISADEGFSGHIIRNGSSILLSEGTTTWEEQTGVEAVGEAAVSWLGVPLLVGDRALGTIYVQSYTTPNLYDEHDRDLLTAIANQVAIALQNAQMVENLERMVEERTAKLRQTIQEREELQQEVIDAQERAIQELSSPIIPVMDRIIVMPLIGTIDAQRARTITRALLAGITQHRARVAILDITGVPIVDSGVANSLNASVKAARLKGARTIVTGISEAVAETIVDLGIDWSNIETLPDLQTGLRAALAWTGRQIV